MKKFLAVLLGVMMLVSVVAVIGSTSVTAKDGEIGQVDSNYKPTGTAITTAEEFAQMAANGEYYLAADITISATYEKEFTGVLDGVGHKITTSVPLFNKTNGAVVQHLVIEGAVDLKTVAGNAAVVAKTANNTTFYNILNKATLKGYTSNGVQVTEQNGTETVVTDEYFVATGALAGIATGNLMVVSCKTEGEVQGCIAGGFVGMVANAETGKAVFKDVHVAANVNDYAADACTLVKTAALKLQGGVYSAVGGVVGIIYEYADVSFETARVEEGVMVRSYTSGAPCGGVYAIASFKSDTYVNYLKNSTVPYLDMTVSLKDCVNVGKAVVGANQTGGIVGWAGYVTLTAEDCSNSAVVTSTGNYCGGVIGRTGEHGFTVKNCENNGKVNPFKSQAGGIIGYTYTKYEGDGLIENCTNYADLTLTAPEACTIYIAGILGQNGNENPTKLVIKGCVNEGNITNATPFGQDSQGKDYTVLAGGILGKVARNVEILDCVNKGDLSSTDVAGGMVAEAQVKEANGPVVIRNCTNYGKVSSTNEKSGGTAGGITGYHGTFHLKEISGCVNYGEIVGGFAAGGIVGDGRKGIETITNCVNNGAVTGIKAGGIAGYLQDGGTKVCTTITKCVNNGDVKGYGKDCQTGGLVGYCWASDNFYLVLNTCVTTGDVTVTSEGAFIAPFIGYTNSLKTTVTYCISTGDLKTETVTDDQVYYVFVGCSNAKYGQTLVTGTPEVPAEGDKPAVPAVPADPTPIKAVLHDNYVVNGNKIKWFSYATAEENAAQRIPVQVALDNGFFTIVEEKDVTFGKVAYQLNTALGSTVYYQELGVETVPSFEASENRVVYQVTGGYSNSANGAPVTEMKTESTVEETTEAPTEEQTTAGGSEEVTTAGGSEEVTTAGEGEETTAGEGEGTTAGEATTAGENVEQGGCKSVIGASIAAVLVLMVAAPAVLLKKKED